MDISEIQRIENYIPEKRHPWEITRARVIRSLVKANGYEPGSTITDIGSGDCFVLNEFRQNKMGSRFTAVDTAFTGPIIQKLKTTYPGIDAFYNSLEEYDHSADTNSSWFLITDVIEHIESDENFLDTLNAISKKTSPAYCLVTVPAYQSLFSEHDKMLGHYRRYDLTQLKDLCTSHKMEIKDSGYFFFSLLLPRFIFKRFNNKKTKTIDHWSGGAFITKMLTTILWLDFKTGRLLKKMGINLPGLSCYCICKI